MLGRLFKYPYGVDEMYILKFWLKIDSARSVGLCQVKFLMVITYYL